MANNILLEQQKQIARFYKTKPMTIEFCAEHFGISVYKCRKALDVMRVRRWDKSLIYSPNLKIDYFKNIDSPNKAYLLGYLMCDGCIFQNRISLSSIDKSVVEFFVNQLCANVKVNNDGRGTWQAGVTNANIVNDLKKYSLTEKSSLTQQFPKNIPQEYIWDFIRGVLDADGSVAFYSRNNRKNSYRKAIRIFSGSEQFIKDLYETTKIGKIYKQKENVYEWCVVRNDDLLLIINNLYKNNGFFLPRKKEVCDRILENISRTIPR